MFAERAARSPWRGRWGGRVAAHGLAVDEAVDLILCDPGDRLAGEICIACTAVFLNGPGGPARRSLRPDWCLRGGPGVATRGAVRRST